jgi:hypothetical protein
LLSQNSNNTQTGPAQTCQLSQDDYAVFTALLAGLGGPEDPEEAWQGKRIVIEDVTTQTGEDARKGRDGWGFRSKSNTAPKAETFADFAAKSASECPLDGQFGPPGSHALVKSDELKQAFNKDHDG